VTDHAAEGEGSTEVAHDVPPVTASSTEAGAVTDDDAATEGATPTGATDDTSAPVDEGGATSDGGATSGGGEARASFVVVEVVSVSFDLPSPSPIVHLLEEAAPYRSMYFPIGLPEAQSIALALASEQAPRPTTHDLLVSVLAAAGCEVVAVRITGERGGTLLAELDLMGPRGHEVVDCRPTDGIAIALRLPVPAPILCEADLLER
jgi:bifunctional DNase/RNase